MGKAGALATDVPHREMPRLLAVSCSQAAPDAVSFDVRLKRGAPAAPKSWSSRATAERRSVSECLIASWN